MLPNGCTGVVVVVVVVVVLEQTTQSPFLSQHSPTGHCCPPGMLQGGSDRLEGLIEGKGQKFLLRMLK